jgi:hypothetical protein
LDRALTDVHKIAVLHPGVYKIALSYLVRNPRKTKKIFPISSLRLLGKYPGESRSKRLSLPNGLEELTPIGHFSKHYLPNPAIRKG